MNIANAFAIVLFCVGACVFCSPLAYKNYQWIAKDLRGDRRADNAIKNSCNCVCGTSNRKMRVVGGNVTKMNEFPWLAGLSANGKFYCGATLITRKHVLTAAHCLYGMDHRKITIVLGDHDRTSPTRFASIVVRTVTKVSMHELFDYSSYNNDIAIVEMNEKVNLDGVTQPACILQSGITDYAGKLAVVAGWGKTGERDETSHVLRKVAVPVWSKRECYASGYGEHKLSENMFCAGYPRGERDACQGDSGGPLHVVNVHGVTEVIGVVSWGRGCARRNLPGIYTKLGNYLDWIAEQLHGECMCPHPKLNPRRV